jgi:hypothetical protein
MRTEYDPSRTLRTITQPPSTRIYQQPVPWVFTNLPVPPQTSMFRLPQPLVPMAAQPPRVMSELRNTGVFSGLSGCGCSGKR